MAPGPVTLTFTAGGASATLSWDADVDVKVSSADGAAGLQAGSGVTVSLYGTPEALNAYLSGGKLKAGGAGTELAAGAE